MNSYILVNSTVKSFNFTKLCQDAPLLAVGRNGILVRGLGGHDFPNMIDRFLLKAPLLAAGMFTISI
jgi:hypothetical protein